MIHAGNSSQLSDGAAAQLFTSAEKAKSLGLKPIAKVHTATLAAINPLIMLSGPIPATQKAQKRSGLSVDEIGAYEVNEAFAPVPLAWLHDVGADEKKLNPNGGVIALGHPLGRLGGSVDDHTAISHARPGNSLRATDDLRRRRSGQLDHPGAAVTEPHASAAVIVPVSTAEFLQRFRYGDFPLVPAIGR